MSGKLLIICASLALASAASIQSADNSLAFETEDAYYVPISDAEADLLGLPSLQSGTANRQKREVAVQAFETEDAWYVPISDEEAAALRLPREIEESNLFAASEEDEKDVESQSRLKRQLNIQGGGSSGQGFDVSAQGRAKLWESDNGRNSVHGTAEYSQHLGGPYGNSQPNFGGGLSFTHRF